MKESLMNEAEIIVSLDSLDGDLAYKKQEGFCLTVCYLAITNQCT